MKHVVLYASEDQQHVELLVAHLLGIQALHIGRETLTVLTAIPVQQVFLLMSISLLLRLVCEPTYEALFRQLKLFEQEELLFIIVLRPCAWADSFTAPALPTRGKTIIHLRQKRRETIYKNLAAQLGDEAQW